MSKLVSFEFQILVERGHDLADANSRWNELTLGEDCASMDAIDKAHARLEVANIRYKAAVLDFISSEGLYYEHDEGYLSHRDRQSLK